MGRSKKSQKVLWVIFVVAVLFPLLSPKVHCQSPGQPASKEQTGSVLTRLVNANLLAMGILLGDQTAPGTFSLVLADGEKCGSIAARGVDDSLWLESLVLTPSAAVMKPSASDVSLRTKLYLFFGNGQTGWHDGTATVSVDRRDVIVQRSSRYDDGLVIQYSYGNWQPTPLFDLKVISWPTPAP